MGRRVLQLVLTVAAALVVLTLGASVAHADNGPHGNYTKTTDKCAACHRAHTAQGSYLLVATSTYELCTSCHGPAGTGANTDVVQGLYIGSRNPAYASGGTTGHGLRGGGFQSAVMNTDWGAGAVSRPVTSSHAVDGTQTGTVWGYGPISAEPSAGLGGISLDCTSCHDPHGGAGSNGQATYRILRTQPVLEGQTLSTTADVNDRTQAYSIGQPDGSYMGEYYDAYAVNISRWCSQCHTRYFANSNAMETPSGDAVFQYRHQSNSNGVACVSCHVAHGSSAQMSGYADLHAVTPGVGTTGTDSALLRLDNRAVCLWCHEFGAD